MASAVLMVRTHTHTRHKLLLGEAKVNSWNFPPKRYQKWNRRASSQRCQSSTDATAEAGAKKLANTKMPDYEQ